ncbi:MAG: calcium-binding EGF-like domain-containing protein [Polyangiaceae bacterium]
MQWFARRRSFLAAGGALALFFASLGACSEYDSPPKDPEIPAVVTCTSSSAPKCGAHGKCTNGTGGAPPTCACDEGYTGATCSECAPNLQDDDHDGVCLPKCDAKCGAHERCNLTTGAPVCECAPGYARANAASACTWAGVVKDPTFGNTPAGAWQLENVALEPTITSAPSGGGTLVDPGAAVMTPATATCPGKIGRLRQTFTMPTAAEGEGLALVTKTFGTNCGTFGLGCLAIPRWKNEGRMLTPLDFGFFSPSGNQRTFCIGERWYGRTVNLEHEITGGCSSGATFAQDHTDIVPSPECALPGTVYNADFDGTGGWDVSGADADSIAEVKESIGTNGSRGGHLGGKRYCKNPALSGNVSIPEFAGKKVALSLTYRGSLGDSANLQLAQFSFGSMKGLGTFERATYCLPDVTKGIAWTLRISLPNVPAPTGVDCANAPGTRDFVFDDLTLAPDPSCPDSVPIADPNFDSRPANTPAWMTDTDGIASSVIQAGGRTGRAGVIATSKYCHGASLSTLMSLPEYPETEGYAITFWQKGNVPSGQTLTTSFGDVPVSSAWEQRSQCLPRLYAGMPYQLNFSTSFNVGGSCEAASTSMIWIDDIEIVKDAACVGK